MASADPSLLGTVHDLAGNRTAPLAVLLAISLQELPPGLAAARDRRIGAEAG